jgi:hypothetical protein
VISWTDEHGAQRRLETAEPTKALRELLARQPEVEEIKGLSVHQPTLEEIYLAMVDGTDAENGNRAAGLSAGQETR